jgi:hypothetical protein
MSNGASAVCRSSQAFAAPSNHSSNPLLCQVISSILAFKAASPPATSAIKGNNLNLTLFRLYLST